MTILIFVLLAVLLAVDSRPALAGCAVEAYGASVATISYPQPFADNPNGEMVSMATPNGFVIVFDAQARVPVAFQRFEQALTDCPRQVTNSLAALPVPMATGSQAMAVGDLNGDGIPDAVTIGSSGGIAVFLGNNSGGFQPEADYAAGSSPKSLVVTDLNGDGKLDVAVATSAGVSVLLGSGDGTFRTAVNYASGAGPNSVATGDFNGDGKIDLAVANTVQGATGNVSVLLGSGDGTFRAAVNYPAGTAPWSIVAGDWNGDGKLDLAVANFRSGDVAVLVGKGDGTFGAATRIAIGDQPTYLGTADLNGDGIPDLVALHGPHSALSVLLGDGKGGFQKLGSYLATQSPEAYQFIVWRDNRLVDLLTAGPGAFSLYQGNGDGTLASAPLYFVAGFPQASAIADFNMDGQPDVVVASNGSVSLLLGAGNGNLSAPTTLKIPLNPGDEPLFGGIAAGDFNGDGIPDLVIADSDDARVSLLLGKGDGTFTQSSSQLTGAGPSLMITGDFNGDGHLDVAVTDTEFGGIWILLGDGKGQLGRPKGHPFLYAQSLAAGDFNGDGMLDLAVVSGGDPSEGGGSVAILLGNGDGSFQSAVNYVAGAFPGAVAIADFNGDGALDLAVSTNDRESSSVAILLGNGDGTFQSAVMASTTAAAGFVIAGDLDGDGWPDMAVAHCCGPATDMTILIGNGDGTFQPELHFPGGDSPNTIAVGDFNGDGRPDLAVTAGAEAAQGTLSILLNNLPLPSAPAQ